MAPVGFLNINKHLTWYLSEGVIIVLDDGTAYRLPTSMLKLDSGCFQGCLSIPGDGKEGLSDDNPIRLPNISSEHFDILLNFQFRHIVPTTPEELMVLLKMGHFFQYDTAQSYAQGRLESMESFPSVQKFILGMNCHIHPWVCDGFRKLVAVPETFFSPEEGAQMGVVPMHTVLTTIIRVWKLRRTTALSVPPVQHAKACRGNFVCDSAWSREWQKVVGHLMHPKRCLPMVTILQQLMDAADIFEMHRECKKRTLDHIYGQKWLHSEEKLVAEQLDGLLRWLNM
ncbi:hypothetical protein C8Q76DRAFT_802425 [Earliella scabrosa]|nr:hypothetical protein C8Q76DRAFT_802680 [Earliella scabrosa]KAI0702138.1 hypothetical protein C8Q76DRAFT_802425 [Earliella scabrosa]